MISLRMLYYLAQCKVGRFLQWYKKGANIRRLVVRNGDNKVRFAVVSSFFSAKRTSEILSWEIAHARAPELQSMTPIR